MDRLTALAEFARLHLGPLESDPIPASSDASFRSYSRVRAGGQSWIIMNAPPDKENVAPFVDIAERLLAAGLNAPRVHAQDRQAGFLLLGDLGDRTYLPELSDAMVDALYGDALRALVQMQSAVQVDGMPHYDDTRLQAEMELFPTWFLAEHLGYQTNADEQALIHQCMQRLLRSAGEQPVAFVHRDYHSRNLMIVPGANPGILDFQDAVIGPVSYDLVSLLKDCYVQWPLPRVYAWADEFRQQLIAAGRIEVGQTRWRRWFDWMGLQRHLKVLGIFARLNYRDGKSGYLNDLPLVLDYTLSVCARYGELAPFGQWLEARTRGVDLTRARTART